MRPHTFFLSILGVALFALMTPIAYAHDAETTLFDDVTDSFGWFESCSEVEGTLTRTFDGILHVNSDGQGGFHTTKTIAGDFVFIPEDDSKPTYNGLFVEEYVAHSNTLTDPDQRTLTATLLLKGTGSDGSELDFLTVQHETVNPARPESGLEKIWCSGRLISG